MELYNILIWYAFGGVLTNFIYDLTVSRIRQVLDDPGAEELRFTMIERIWVGIVWPLFIVTFTIKIIKILNGKD